MSKYGALVVFGSGPGVGINIATLFAERGFSKVILLSRDATRLAKESGYITSKTSAKVQTIPIDLSKSADLQAALHKCDDFLEDTPLQCVFYNAARLGQSKLLEFSPDTLRSDLEITVVSLYATAQWAMPKLLKADTAAFFASSGMLGKDPSPAMFSLAAGKAGQFNLVHSLHKEFEPQGVHCALVVIGGKVADESKVTNARNIAEETWKLFTAEKGKGKHEIVLLDPAFLEHVKNREKLQAQ